MNDISRNIWSSCETLKETFNSSVDCFVLPSYPQSCVFRRFTRRLVVHTFSQPTSFRERRSNFQKKSIPLIYEAMVSVCVLAFGSEGRGFDPWSGQTFLLFVLSILMCSRMVSVRDLRLFVLFCRNEPRIFALQYEEAPSISSTGTTLKIFPRSLSSLIGEPYLCMLISRLATVTPVGENKTRNIRLMLGDGQYDSMNDNTSGNIRIAGRTLKNSLNSRGWIVCLTFFQVSSKSPPCIRTEWKPHYI